MGAKKSADIREQMQLDAPENMVILFREGDDFVTVGRGRHHCQNILKGAHIIGAADLQDAVRVMVACGCRVSIADQVGT